MADIRDPKYYMLRANESIQAALREMNQPATQTIPTDIVEDNLDMAIRLLVLAKAERQLTDGTK